MSRIFGVIGLAAVLAAPAAFAQPTPTEQVGGHVGNAATNGSATIVTDRTGTHPDGFTGMALINRTSAAKEPGTTHRHHHRHHTADTPNG